MSSSQTVNRAKRKLQSRELCVGITINWISPSLAETLALLDFDLVVVDGEHGGIDDEAFENVIRAAQVWDVPTLIRQPMAPWRFSRYLDMGAIGIQVPQVDTADEARMAVDAVKFPPLGLRGMGRTRASGFGLRYGSPLDFARVSNEETIIMVQIESVEAVKNAAEIVKIPEVDVILIGTTDLSQSLGVVGQTEHPYVLEAVKKVGDMARNAGKVVGLPAATPEQLQKAYDRGARYILTATSNFLNAGCRSFIAARDAIGS